MAESSDCHRSLRLHSQPFRSEHCSQSTEGPICTDDQAMGEQSGLDMSEEFDDVADFIVEEDAGGSELDDFDETVQREHLKFLEQQQRKKEAAAKGRAWSAPARPTSLSSPSSAVQRKRSAERSGELEFEALETPRVEYDPASCARHARADESPRQHRPKSAFEIGRDFFVGIEHAEQYESQHGLQDILEDAPFVSQEGTSESDIASAKKIETLNDREQAGNAEVDLCTDRPPSRMESHNAATGDRRAEEGRFPLSGDGKAVASISATDLTFEDSRIGSFDLSSPGAERNTSGERKPAWDDSTRAHDSQSSGQQRRKYSMKSASCLQKRDVVQRRPGSANRSLAYYGILGLQGKGKTSEHSPSRTRPPSAPATSPHRSKHRKQMKNEGKIDPAYRRPPSGRSAGQLRRPPSRTSSDNQPCTQRSASASLRPQSAHQLGQLSSYFESMLRYALPSAKILEECMSGVRTQVEKGRPSSIRSSSFGYSSCASQEGGRSSLRGQHEVPAQYFVGDPRHTKKRARSMSYSQRSSKARPETAKIYASNILNIISEANQNACKVNSRYRYRLDDRPGCHEVYLQVFDTLKGEWLVKPWTLKRFFSKHHLMQERAKFMKSERRGTGSSAATPRSGMNSARSSCRGHESDEFGFVPAHAHRIPNPKIGCCEDKEVRSAFEEERKRRIAAENRGSVADDCARKALVDALASIDGVGQNCVQFSMSPNMKKMRSELVEIEKLCRQVSTQVRLTREFV